MAYKNKEDQQAAQRRWYEQNTELHKARSKERRARVGAENRSKIIKIKESNPCTDCKEFYPFYVMQFDHINNDKHADVGTMVNHSWSAIQREIEKCELVCANCHAARTWTRNNGC